MNVIKGVVIGLTFLVAALFWLGVNKKEPYSIKHPPKNRQHAIISLISANENKPVWNCSAFVISDTAAITAGHCIRHDKDYRGSEEYKRLAEQVDLSIKDHEAELQRIAACFTWQCENAAKQLTEGLKKLKEAKKKWELLETDIFLVRNIYGQDTGIRATAEHKHLDGRDHGILSGNFKDFEKMPVKIGFTVKKGDKLRACGYAMSNTPPVCTDFIALGNLVFKYAGEGYVVSGMSGGPVVDEDGFAVGIVSASHENYVSMDTLLGVLEFKFERPKIKPLKKREK
jgi:hypothetical protein